MKNAKTIGYWAATGIIAFTIGSGGVAQALRLPGTVEGMAKLGYPEHFVVLLGVWKALGALALVAPGFRRLKEWAYAGIFFELTGAAIANASNGAPAFHVVAPLAIGCVLVASYLLRPASRRWTPPVEETSEPARGLAASAKA